MISHRSLTWILALVGVAYISCSTSEKKYAGIIEFAASKEQLMNSEINGEIKLRACDTVIVVLRDFVSEHREGDLYIRASSELDRWIKIRNKITTERDYQNLKETEEISENLYEKNFDFEIKIEACDNMISSIQEYLWSHRDTLREEMLRTALKSWEVKKVAAANELGSLKNRLGKLLEQRARDEAGIHHPLSNIERIERVERTEDKEGKYILVKDKYNIRMRGSVIGKSIFKLKVDVSGRIAMHTKVLSVSDEVFIEE